MTSDCAEVAVKYTDRSLATVGKKLSIIICYKCISILGDHLLQLLRLVIVVFLVVRVLPASTHFDGLIPLFIHFAARLLTDPGLEEGAPIGIDLLEVVKVLPHPDGKAGGDGGSQRGRLAHLGTVNGDLDEIGLCL